MGRKMIHSIILVCLVFLLLLPSASVKAAEAIELFTPYSGISVTPGETVNYSFDIMNHTTSVERVKVSLEGIPDGWEYTLASGGREIQELAVKPGEPGNFTVDLTVPLQVEKGNYAFTAVATSANGEKTSLPLTVKVTEKGTFKTDFSAEQTNLEGHSESTFDYSTELKNRTGEEQTYGLVANPPKGWTVDFTVDGNSVSSVTIDSNASKEIKVNVTPAKEVKAGTYEIPIRATNEKTTSDLELEAVITGSYDVELTTPSGKLSENITAGKEKNIQLLIKNTGTAPLGDISLSANTPEGWDVTFDSSKIGKLDPKQSVKVKAKVKANKNAIAGDYVLELKASSPEASSDAQFRMTVKTSLIWGWVGIAIIVFVIWGIFYLIRKYGRR